MTPRWVGFLTNINMKTREDYLDATSSPGFREHSRLITKDNRRAAWEVPQKIRQTVKQLKEHPRLGREGRVRGTYELVIPALP